MPNALSQDILHQRSPEGSPKTLWDACEKEVLQSLAAWVVSGVGIATSFAAFLAGDTLLGSGLLSTTGLAYSFYRPSYFSMRDKILLHGDKELWQESTQDLQNFVLATGATGLTLGVTVTTSMLATSLPDARSPLLVGSVCGGLLSSILAKQIVRATWPLYDRLSNKNLHPSP